MAKGLPPNGFTGKVHEIDAKAGGRYRMSFTKVSTGNSHSFGGEYLDLAPNERIRHTDRFDSPNMTGKSSARSTARESLQGRLTGGRFFCARTYQVRRTLHPDVFELQVRRECGGADLRVAVLWWRTMALRAPARRRSCECGTSVDRASVSGY
jgi:uncharacterized protein YndB with AHSA1/START domain